MHIKKLTNIPHTSESGKFGAKTHYTNFHKKLMNPKDEPEECIALEFSTESYSGRIDKIITRTF